MEVRLLRNELCHFSVGLSAADYDRKIKHAQAVAVELLDAPRAIRLRALRDDLRVAASEALERIETLGCASIVHVAHYWEPEHEVFFRGFYNYMPRDLHLTIDGIQFSPAVGLAVRAWRWQKAVY
ncbi:hypothetical protein PG994_008225 [Apiospora phragmitis]|uniref:Uncharacterized protein n=1 Tax=Apiospora phragmitis TaxID=2905665 RepID=A0ABR1USF9_9PEZI